MSASPRRAIQPVRWGCFLFSCCLISVASSLLAENEQSTSNVPTAATQTQSSPVPQKTRQNFLSHMTKAHSLVEQENWLEAAKAINVALSINPQSQAAVELGNFINQQLSHQTNAQNVQRFKELIAHEMWSDAHALGKTLVNSTQELMAEMDRVARLTVIEQELVALLGQPSLLSKKPAAARIERVNRLAKNLDSGVRLSAQLETLNREHKRWTTPVQITLVSDNKTNVLIRPGRNLGKFKVKHLELMPGNYVVLGRRQGHREAREALSLEPGAPPSRVIVIADQSF